MDGAGEKAARGTGAGEEGPGGAAGDAGRRTGLWGKQGERGKQAARRLRETKPRCQGRQGEEEKEEKASRWQHVACLNRKCHLTVTDAVTADATDGHSGPESSTRTRALHFIIHPRTDPDRRPPSGRHHHLRRRSQHLHRGGEWFFIEAPVK